jgi:hypothetical protein
MRVGFENVVGDPALGTEVVDKKGGIESSDARAKDTNPDWLTVPFAPRRTERREPSFRLSKSNLVLENHVLGVLGADGGHPEIVVG